MINKKGVENLLEFPQVQQAYCYYMLWCLAKGLLRGFLLCMIINPDVATSKYLNILDIVKCFDNFYSLKN